MKDFFQELLSSGVKYSFGRFMSLITACFCISWDTAAIVFNWRFNMYLVHNHLSPPFAIQDILPSAGALTAQIAFMGFFYTATKAGDVMQNNATTAAGVQIAQANKPSV